MLQSKLNTNFQNVPASPMQKMFQASSQYDNLINLGVGEPDLDAPKEVIAALKESADAGFTHYPPMNGFPDLRQEVCNYWGKYHGLALQPNEVLITAGGIQAIYLVLAAFVNPGDEVLVTDPCFPSYIAQVRYVGGKLVPIPLREEDEFVLTAAALEKAITPKSKLLILNSPSNPSGAVIPRDEMERIAAVVKKHDLIVLSDEIYEAFVYEGEHVSFATLPGMKERTFTLGGYSKTYAMTGFRLGYLMGDAGILQTLHYFSTDTVMGVNSMVQKAGVVALRDCRYFVDDMVRIYKERVEHTARLINQTPGMHCKASKGSFYIMANIAETGMKSTDFSLRMINEARVVMMPGISFGAAGDDFVRISCNGKAEVLEQAFERVANALNGKPFAG